MVGHEYNTQIKKAGLRYLGHYDRPEIMVYGDSWGIKIPQDRLREFVKIFPELDWEDGVFLQDIEGQYVRLVSDGKLNIVSLKHIVKDLEYKVEV